jgi:hypothetical protein
MINVDDMPLPYYETSSQQAPQTPAKTPAKTLPPDMPTGTPPQLLRRGPPRAPRRQKKVKARGRAKAKAKPKPKPKAPSIDYRELPDSTLLRRDEATIALEQISGVRFGPAALQRMAHERTGPPYRRWMNKAIYTLGALREWVKAGTQAVTP